MSDSRQLAAPASGSVPDIPTYDELIADPEIAALLDFEPAPVKPRVNGWDPEAQRALVALIAVTGSKIRAAAAIGRNPGSLDRIFGRESGAPFRAACDAAFALHRRRHGVRLAEGVASAAASDSRRWAAASRKGGGPGAPLPGQVMNEHGEWEDEDSYRRRGEEAIDSVRDKLVRARRLYLLAISQEPIKRAAFEILTELPVDWELAARNEPQPFEPWLRTNQRQPDMVLTAESGWSFGDIGYGPDKKAELRNAINEYRAEQGLEPIEEESDQQRTSSPSMGRI